jgi:hypothetical protein
MKMHNFDPKKEEEEAKCVLESPLNGIEMNCDLPPISTSSNQCFSYLGDKNKRLVNPTKGFLRLK